MCWNVFPGSSSCSPTPAVFCLIPGAGLTAVIASRTLQRAKISKPPSEYVKLLYFDTITHSRMALEYLIANFGADHVLLGSDYPYDMGDPEPVASLAGDSNRRTNKSSEVAGANACKLFRIGI